MNENVLKKVQKEELDILVFFDAFCRQHNLRYSLAYGSLLGAVRHKGFIPWDDDIDVIMPREDYELLIRLFDDKTNRFFLQSHYSEAHYYYPFAKIRKNGTVFREKFLEDKQINHGFYIDVFPADKVRDKKRKKDYFYIRYQNTILHSKFIKNKYCPAPPDARRSRGCRRPRS